MCSWQPSIIIGMHRSGTSMISRMLEDLGLFVGKQKDVNHEAVFFHNLNDWLLCQCGGSWDHPRPIQHLLDHAQARALAVDYIRHMMKSFRVTSYLGWKRYLRYQSPINLDFAWGWKDPRNTFTLPIWLDIFPGVKVVHVYRHGVDVANSLRVRVNKRLAGAGALHDKRKRWLLYWLCPKRGGFADTMRCTCLEGGFSLWEDYMQEARSHVESLGNKAIELKYEEFLADPLQGLASLLQFCNLSVADTMIDRVAQKVKRGRAYGYRQDPELREFAASVSTRLAKWGY